MRRYARTLAVIVVLVIAAALALGFQTFNIGGFERGDDTVLGLQLGLDLQGGSHLVYQAALTDETTGEDIQPTADQMEALKRTIERRVNSSGLGEPIIQILGDDRLLVQIPGVSDPERIKSLIGETARLEFKHRMLNVARPLEFDETGILQMEIIEVMPPDSAGATNNATSTTETAGENNSSTPQTAENATSTPSANSTSTATTTPGTFPPGLQITFSDSAAEEFAQVVADMQQSLEPSEGVGSVYPDLITIAPTASDEAELRIPYQQVFFQPGGQSIPLGGDPFVYRLPNSNTFVINLGNAYGAGPEAMA
ncbi:MAG: hypothetical protein O3B84_06610, partial [Chloroflexi bacterium]|nr:hypothetical protein [Chloroflexota bacterium]